MNTYLHDGVVSALLDRWLVDAPDTNKHNNPELSRCFCLSLCIYTSKLHK